jgi:hypothetical protein
MVTKHTVESAALITARTFTCLVCKTKIIVNSATSPHVDAPEMLHAPSEAWIGFVDAGDIHPQMITVCSLECLRQLLKEA